MTKLSFEDLATIEPRLLDLEDAVRSLCANDRMQEPHIWSAIWSAYPNGLKRQLETLVGWYAENPEIRDEGSWNIAVRHITGLLREINEIASGQLDPDELRPRTHTDLTRSRNAEAAHALAEKFMEPSHASTESARSVADLMPEYLRSLRDDNQS